MRCGVTRTDEQSSSSILLHGRFEMGTSMNTKRDMTDGKDVFAVAADFTTAQRKQMRREATERAMQTFREQAVRRQLVEAALQFHARPS
jgi:hypothetical protein